MGMRLPFLVSEYAHYKATGGETAMGTVVTVTISPGTFFHGRE
jgi:hypothetical protein